MHHIRTHFIKTIFLLSPIISLSAGFSTYSQAGFEEGCSSNFQLNNNQYQGCDNLPVLIPSNDNHINMYLLLSDLGLANISPIQNQPESLWMANSGIVPFEHDALAAFVSNKMPNARIRRTANSQQYYDERCLTLESGREDFQQNLAKLSIPTAEKNKLNAERRKLIECNQKLSFIAINPQWSTLAKQYASYINANIAFYNNKHDTALKIYIALSKSQDPWLMETSQYMQIRTLLNLIYQASLDEYGDLNRSKINQNQLKNYFNSITDYFKLYPNGRYVASARGLLRRGHWLLGRKDLLIQEYIWQLNNPKSKFYNLEMNSFAEELDRRIFRDEKLNIQDLKHPFLITTYALMHMRKSESADDQPLTWSALNSQKDAFKEYPEIFQYLQAVHLFHIQKKPQQALEQLAKNPSNKMPYLALSIAFLKGEIMERIQQQNVQQYWNTQHQQAKDTYSRNMYEFFVALHAYKNQDYAAFIGQSAKIQQAYLQRRFITEYANEKSLEKILNTPQSSAEQKQAALYSLLSKSLIHQQYNLFNQYITQLPPRAMEYQGAYVENSFKNHPRFSNFIWQGSSISPELKCPDLKSLSTQLAAQPKADFLNVCLGEYMRSEKAPSYYEINANNTFQGKPFARGKIYRDIIQNGPRGDLHAYALYRAIQCYAPSGYNDCGDEEVAKSVRKQWFDRIKKEYPNTSWAKSLKYYW